MNIDSLMYGFASGFGIVMTGYLGSFVVGFFLGLIRRA